MRDEHQREAMLRAQEELARSLLGEADAPPGFDPSRVGAARDVLAQKKVRDGARCERRARGHAHPLARLMALLSKGPRVQ